MTKVNFKTTTYKVNSEIIKEFFDWMNHEQEKRYGDIEVNLYNRFNPDDFYIDIVDDGEFYTAFLYENSYAHKGFIEKQKTGEGYYDTDDFAEYIESVLIGDQHLGVYCEEETGKEIIKLMGAED